MPYKHRRACPICGKLNLLNLSGHLRQVHGLWDEDQRVPWLQRASLLSPVVPIERVENPVILPPSSCTVIPVSNSHVPCLADNRPPPLPIDTLETQPYPDFAFQHPYSMIVVGPSQCGKTHFVHQLLTHKCTTYPNKKPVRVVWCYNQWQPQYDEIQRDLGSNIRFFQGVPELEEDLREIKTSKHTIFVLDDLMAQAKDSPVVSKLFTQGRHRNASVILLLQNMFPKGKYNTDISRNATYKVLFRSPGDRKQIDIMAEQTFAKDRPRFMQAYHRETAQPYGYIVVDNHPRTTSEHQVVANVLGDCYTYPYVTSTTSPPLTSRIASVQLQASPLKESPLPEQPVTVPRKRAAPVISQLEVRPPKKRKTNDGRVGKRPAPFIKKVQAAKKRKAVPKRVPTKKRKSKSVSRKQPVYDSSDDGEMIIGPKTKREMKQEEEDSVSNSEEEGDDEITSEEDDSDSVEGEVDDDPEEEEEGEEGEEEQDTLERQWRGGPGRIAYDDMSPEQATLKHAFYNPHLYHPRRCAYRAGGFGPRPLGY